MILLQLGKDFFHGLQGTSPLVLALVVDHARRQTMVMMVAATPEEMNHVVCFALLPTTGFDMVATATEQFGASRVDKNQILAHPSPTENRRCFPIILGITLG
jgi:hypothetical protein